MGSGLKNKVGLGKREYSIVYVEIYLAYAN